MRILLAPDLHTWYEGPGPAEARIEEWHACAKALVAAAKEHACTLALFPGDFYVTNRPSSAQVLAVIDLFTALDKAGVRVVGIAGNHDVAAPEQPNFVSVVGAMQSEWGITRPQVVTHGDLAIACLPWIKGATDEALSLILQGLVVELLETRATNRIVLAHYATDTSVYSSGESAIGREACLRLAELQTLPVDLIVLGHIHKPQTLRDAGDPLSPGPEILHVGALTRRDFGEERDDRVAAIYDTETRTVHWVPLPARRFLTIDAKNPPVLRDDIVGAYVRLTYRATEDDAAQVDHGELIRRAQDDGAFHVAGVFPDIIRTDRGRAEGLSESTDPLKALETWLSLKTDLPEDTRGRVLTAGRDLLQEVGA